jgi:outer membrane lipoprotein-sorting protein
MRHAAPCAETDASALIRKCDAVLRGKTAHALADMVIVNPNWRRTVSMESWSEGTERFFIHVTSPQREKGTTFLKLGNLLYQWIPSAEMRIKITPSMMLQSWMGSDFTNDDLVKESSMVDDYTHSLLGTEILEGVQCFKLRLDPKPQAPIVWGRLVIWIRTRDYLPAREEFYNERGEMVKVMTFSDFRRANDRTYPMRWVMVPLNKQGHRTEYVLKSIIFNEKIDPAVFTLRNMEKPR